MPNNNQHKIQIIGIVIISVLLLGLMYTLLTKQQITKEYSLANQSWYANKIQLENKIDVYEGNINSLESEKNQLTNNINNLSDEFNNLTETHYQLSKEHESLLIETNYTLNRIDKYQEELEDSIKWFQENAELPVERPYTIVAAELEKCIDGNKIKTACFFLINKHYLDIHYQDDPTLTGKIDKLQDLRSFIVNKGGDCEDYALFFKAEWDAVKKIIAEDTGKDINPEAWYDDSNAKGKYFVWGEWYMLDATHINLKYYTEATMICGSFWDYDEEEWTGHCVIALSKKPVQTEEDFIHLIGSAVIEPQNGELIGYLETGPNGITLADYAEENMSSIIIDQIITDDDRFLFDWDNKEWQSYSSFLNEINIQENKLIEFFKK